jgi:predicted small lipoprotein YifL
MLHLKPYFLVFLLGITLLVYACGQTGDLYLPEEEAEESKAKQSESKKENSKN